MTPRVEFAVRFGSVRRTALVLASVVVMALVFAPTTLAQMASASQANPNSEWETAAGGHLEFDVVSIHPVKDSDEPSSVNVPYGPEDAYTDTGGIFKATNWPVIHLIAFAYKNSTAQRDAFRASLPDWALNKGFDIEARAENPPCDQRPDAPDGAIHAHPALRPQGALRDAGCFGLCRRAHQARRFRAGAPSSSQR